MAGKGNLKSLAERTTEEQREIARKGGKKSGEVRRNKRDMREALKIFLEMPASEALDSQLDKLGVSEDERTNAMGVVARHVIQAQSGNIQSARFVSELAGELLNGFQNNTNINVNAEEDKFVFYIPEQETD